VDTLVTILIVTAAAAWAALRIWRRATAKPFSCGGTCAGCDGGRETRPTTPGSPEDGSCAVLDGGTATGIPLPSRVERKG
jgi:hypothetical protein